MNHAGAHPGTPEHPAVLLNLSSTPPAMYAAGALAEAVSGVTELRAAAAEAISQRSQAAAGKIQPAAARSSAAAAVSADRSQDELNSSLERLKRTSQALNGFVRVLRQQYALDETADAGVGKPQPAAVSSPTADGARLRPPVEAHRPFAGKGILQTTARFFLQSFKQPDVFVHHYGNFAKELLKIALADSSLEPDRNDKRFRDAVWKDNFMYRTVMQAYLAWDHEVAGWIDDLDMDDADRRRSRFIYEQLSAALAPTNSPLNPVAVKRAYQTGGRSVLTGLQNFLDDLRHNHGMPSQVKEGAYTLGKELANSPGAVVYRTELLELIQYQMAEGQIVSGRPVLIVPPQLNKFYVFDLAPKNSIVQYLQTQGIQPFIISWRNPSKQHADWGLERYVLELEKALEVICEITGSEQVNLVSACAGGLTSMALLGYLQARNKPLVHSHSLFVTALQADESFQLGLFASREAVELSRKLSRLMGYMDGKTLSHIFAWMRPTDLVWNFWINNYLLGKEPPALDVLYWDNDSTRLPAQLHSDFLDLFLEEVFVNPGRLTINGYAIDLRQLTMDFYCVAGDEDYLIPWKKCFEVPRWISGETTFVLSTSGHIQSLLRPPGIANTVYYTNDARVDDADEWLQTATKNGGSWWEHWAQWLKQHSGKSRFAPLVPGSEQYPPLSPAPGLYVTEKPA